MEENVYHSCGRKNTCSLVFLASRLSGKLEKDKGEGADGELYSRFVKRTLPILAMWSVIQSLFASVTGGARREEFDPSEPSSLQKNRSVPTPILRIVALVVSDYDRKILESISGRSQWAVHFVATYEETCTALNQLNPPVILCDRDLLGADWRDIIRNLASVPHSACVVLLSKVVDDRLWNEVIRIGGYDVLSKPLREDDAVRAVKLAWSYWNSTKPARLVTKQRY